jgi:hypothetical protein
MKQDQYGRPTILEWNVHLTVIWSFQFGACALIHIFVRNEKNTEIVVLKILGSPTQNFVAQATWHPEFLHRWFTRKNKLSITEQEHDTNICILPYATWTQ